MLIELLKHSVDAAPAGFGGCVDAGSRQMVWRVARSPQATRPFTTLCRGAPNPHNSGERSPGFRLCAARAGACMRQGAAEQIASEAARAAARAEPNSVQNLLKYQLPVSTIGGEGGILTPFRRPSIDRKDHRRTTEAPPLKYVVAAATFRHGSAQGLYSRCTEFAAG
jgi:hypothetical protein